MNRFDQIQADLSISRKVLTERLHDPVEQGVLERRPYDARPRFEYHLTEKGADLVEMLMVMVRWGDRWLAGQDGPPVLYRHHACGRLRLLPAERRGASTGADPDDDRAGAEPVDNPAAGSPGAADDGDRGIGEMCGVVAEVHTTQSLRYKPSSGLVSVRIPLRGRHGSVDRSARRPRAQGPGTVSSAPDRSGRLWTAEDLRKGSRRVLACEFVRCYLVPTARS